MLFHSELEPHTAVYHDIISLEVKGVYDRDVMRKVLGDLISRHETLRTSFDLTTYSEPLQLVHKHVDDPVQEEDLSSLAEPAQEEEVKRWIAEEKRRPIDWKTAPMLRVNVHQMTGDRFHLSISFHHAILDGWSFATMLTEIFQEYWRIQSGQQGQLSRPVVKYRQYIAMELDAIRDENSQRYWSSPEPQTKPGRLETDTHGRR